MFILIATFQPLNKNRNNNNIKIKAKLKTTFESVCIMAAFSAGVGSYNIYMDESEYSPPPALQPIHTVRINLPTCVSIGIRSIQCPGDL